MTNGGCAVRISLWYAVSLSSAHDHRVPFLLCEILDFYFPGDHYLDEYLHSQYPRFCLSMGCFCLCLIPFWLCITRFVILLLSLNTVVGHVSQLFTNSATDLWAVSSSMPKLVAFNADGLLIIVNYTAPFSTDTQRIRNGRFIQDHLN